MRRFLAAGILAGAMGITLVSSPGDQVSDRAAIQKLLDPHGIAWTKGDPVIQ
jgi:hypothetical protein